MIIRINTKQLEALEVVEMGMIDAQLARDLREYSNSVRALASPDLKLVRDALDAIIATLGPADVFAEQEADDIN